MIAFKYTKTDGAEYLSHLDLLRHIDRTLRRAGIAVGYSQGFNKHPRIFMGNPLALGVRSVAEYCTADTEFDGDFKAAFNTHSPDGVKCLDCRTVQNNPNYTVDITSCLYSAQGLAEFDTAAFMARESIVITDKRGREVDIRPRILSLERIGDELKFRLGCGESNLRPDLFCEVISGIYGGEVKELIKLQSFGNFVF